MRTKIPRHITPREITFWGKPLSQYRAESITLGSGMLNWEDLSMPFPEILYCTGRDLTKNANVPFRGKEVSPPGHLTLLFVKMVADSKLRVVDVSVPFSGHGVYQLVPSSH